MGMVEQQQQQEEYSSYYSVEQQRVELPEGVRALTGLTSGARLDDDKIIPRYQCCGYGMLSSRFRFFFLPDPGSNVTKIPDPHQEFNYFNPKMFLSSRKYDLDCLSRIWILIFYLSLIPDPVVKKALDPGNRNTARYRRGTLKGQQRAACDGFS
jgi:hypothetical protein